MDDGLTILTVGCLLSLGLGASLLAGRLRVPALVLFLGIGMLVGSDGLGIIAFSDYELARFLGTVALALILFEGGLTTGWCVVRGVLAPAVSLAIAGTLITAVVAGLAASWLLGLSTIEGLLLGAIVASTDGAAIFAVLRGSTLRRRLAHTLEAEAGFNDPVAVLLVVGFIDWIQKPDYGGWDMAGLFVTELGIGVGVGVVIGLAGAHVLERLRLASAGLFPVATLGIAAIAFGLAAVLHGSGFLAVYLAGLVVGDARYAAKRATLAFHEGLAWLSQVGMFLMLGLLVFPSQLGDVWVEGTVLAVVLAVVARPGAVLAATAPFGFAPREQATLGWAGLRGAVPCVLATFPIIAGVHDSLEFFNIVFFAVVVSTILQGASFEQFAERLGVTSDQPALPRPLADSGTIRGLGAEVVEYPVGPGDAIVGARIHRLGLPTESLVSVIVRDGAAVMPHGATVIEAGDELHVLVRAEAAPQLPDLLDRWRDGPIDRSRRDGHFPRGAGAIFTSRPWTAGDGDPSGPDAVNGIPVIEVLSVRAGGGGCVVALGDGRFAVCGAVLAVGVRPQLVEWCRPRLARAGETPEGDWWREVIGALA